MLLVSIGESQATDTVNYDTITKGMDMYLQRESELEDKVRSLSFRNIIDHRLINGYNSSYEVLSNWEDWYITWEPVSVMRRDDTIYLANYAHDNELIGNTGWKQPHRYVKNTKNMNRLLKAHKTLKWRNTVNIKFGVKIPCDHKEEIMFDADNRNTNWKGAEILELKEIYNFDPF